MSPHDMSNRTNKDAGGSRQSKVLTSRSKSIRNVPDFQVKTFTPNRTLTSPRVANSQPKRYGFRCKNPLEIPFLFGIYT